MSFFKKLFGGSDSAAKDEDASAAKVLKEVEHEGFMIRATPFKQEGQFQTCGVVSREIDGQLREHRFIRADRFADADTAAMTAIQKGKQLIAEQGERMFD